ncbi:MAG TPA: antibiotic biosynthesis monooxygenase [Streptosporangiaceae bacterium]|nr:antibiotic biosynthesis monooxygenase [Streptosporangiaceae bacterium]
MAYGYIGAMESQPGKRDEVVTILLSGLDGLKAAGCVQYTVGVSLDDDVTIWTSEVWGSKEEHDASLQLPEVKEAIGRAMPMLAGDFTNVEVTVQGGLGL